MTLESDLTISNQQEIEEEMDEEEMYDDEFDCDAISWDERWQDSFDQHRALHS